MNEELKNISSQDLQKFGDEVKRLLEEEQHIPLKVSIMGQTGVGKSSLLNALFNTNLKTDPIRPCTKEIEQIIIKGSTGYELWFYDLPGIGESEKADARYLNDYRNKLIESDVVLWAIHADNRSVTFDLDALHKILEPIDSEQQGLLLSKITFVLTKADLLAPPPWILTKVGNTGVFVPHPDTKTLLEQKELYYQETFILPFKDLLTAQTYHDGDFNVNQPLLAYDKYNVYYQGYLSKEKLTQLKRQYPKHESVFDRLYDGYRVISCSSLFRYNLILLMRIIVDKLGTDAIVRFSNFYNDSNLNTMPFSQAKKYCNIMIFDKDTGRVIFDLVSTKI